jgi:hypothetical protein
VAIELFQRSFSKESWPPLKLSPDESRAFHLMTNAVNVYDPEDFAAGTPPSQYFLSCTFQTICKLLAMPCSATKRPTVKVRGKQRATQRAGFVGLTEAQFSWDHFLERARSVL